MAKKKQFHIAKIRVNCMHWANEEEVKPYLGIAGEMQVYADQARKLGLNDDEIAEDLAEMMGDYLPYDIRVRTFGQQDHQAIFIDLE